MKVVGSSVSMYRRLAYVLSKRAHDSKQVEGLRIELTADPSSRANNLCQTLMTFGIYVMATRPACRIGLEVLLMNWSGSPRPRTCRAAYARQLA